MNTREELLALRRERLIARSAELRGDLAIQAQSIQHSAISIGVGLRILDRIRRHPEWIIAAGVGLAIIKPRRLSALLRLGASALRSWRTIGPMLQGMLDGR